jgi:hypothetical protein
VAFPTFQEKTGALSATGLAVESVFGTAVAANSFQPMMSNTMEEDPGWFSPAVMQNLRDKQVYNLYGEAKYTGTVGGPLFPSEAMEFLVASIGKDGAVGYGVAAPQSTPAPASTTLSASSNVGATTISVTSATGIVVGQQIVIDSAGNQEFRLVSVVSGTTITLADALVYAHASAAPVLSGTTTTLSSAASANATTVVVTSPTGISVGTIIQIDVNSVSGSTTSEVRAVTAIATDTLTLDTALVYAHASGAQVSIVVAPFTHQIIEQNTLPSLTVEKNIGGYQSLQFAGCRVGKFGVKAPVGNTPVEVSVDLSGRSVNTLSTPTGVTLVNEEPFVFAEANLTMFSTLRTEVSTVNFNIDNGLKETYTYSNQHGPSFITPCTLMVNGTIDLVWDSLTDATYGDFTKMANGTLGALQFTLVHPSSAGTITFNCPQIVLSKYANDLKMEDVVMSTLSFEASRPLAGSTLYTVQAVVVNNTHTAY